MSQSQDSFGRDASTNHENWFFDDLGGRGAVGPISRAEILSLIKTGTLPRSSLVWKDGFEDWLEVTQTDLMQSRPPTRPKHTKDRGEGFAHPALLALGFLLIAGGVLLIYRQFAGKLLMVDDCTWIENLDRSEFNARLALLPLDQRMEAATKFLQFQTNLVTGQNQNAGTFDEKRLAVCKEARAIFEPIMKY